MTGILRIGGTILGTTNRGNPFAYPIETSGGKRDYSDRCVEMFHELKLDALVVIGGDGTLAIAHEFHKRGIPIVGVPKTIDNDIVDTTNTFGFDTAVSFATDAIDRLHTTAEAHHRVMVVEVMGRYAGWIALIRRCRRRRRRHPDSRDPVRLEKVAQRIREREQLRRAIQHRRRGRRREAGRRASLVAVKDAGDTSSGSVASRRSWRRDLEKLTGKETRYVVLGHLQRGGAPTSFDRAAGDPLRRAGGRTADEGSSARWWRSIRPTSSRCRWRRSSAGRAGMPLRFDVRPRDERAMGDLGWADLNAEGNAESGVQDVEDTSTRRRC